MSDVLGDAKIVYSSFVLKQKAKIQGLKSFAKIKI